MDFASVELFSVTYGLHLILLEKSETQQTCKQTVKQLPEWWRFTHHTIKNLSLCSHFFNHVNEVTTVHETAGKKAISKDVWDY